MVHALREIHRTLIAEATLIDLRPITAPRALQILRPSGVQVVGDFDVVAVDPDDEAANDALRQAVRRGWFVRERVGRFPLATYWDSVDEMKTHVTERWTSASLGAALEKAAHREISRSPGRLRSWGTMMITRLIKSG